MEKSVGETTITSAASCLETLMLIFREKWNTTETWLRPRRGHEAFYPPASSTSFTNPHRVISRSGYDTNRLINYWTSTNMLSLLHLYRCWNEIGSTTTECDSACCVAVLSPVHNTGYDIKAWHQPLRNKRQLHLVVQKNYKKGKQRKADPGT